MTIQTYALIDSNGSVINTIVSDGTLTPDEGHTLVATGASGAAIGWTYRSGTFTAPAPVVPSLQQAQTDQAATLRAACASAIVAGFASSALGSPYTYPCTPTDQINLAASVIASQLPANASNNAWVTPFWCADAENVWAMRNHTAAQIQQVGMDAYTAVKTQQLKAANLTTEVLAASTVGAVQAIVW